MGVRVRVVRESRIEKNTENEVCVHIRHFYWWARDREVAREPESGCRALLPYPMAHARRHARAVSCAMRARHSSANSEVVSCTEVDLRRGWFKAQIGATDRGGQLDVKFVVGLLRGLSALHNTASDGPLVENRKRPSHRETKRSKRASNGM